MKKRNRFTYIGMLVIGILFSSIIISKYSKFYIGELGKTLLTVAEAGVIDIQTDENLESSVYTIIDNSVEDLTGFCAYSLRTNKYSKGIMDELYNQIKAIGYIYYMHATCNDETQTAVGTFLAAPGEPGCKLTPEEIYLLAKQGSVHTEQYEVTAANVEGEYYAVIVWSPDTVASVSDDGRAMTAEDGETILYVKDTEEGEIVYSASDKNYLWKSAEEVLGSSVDIKQLCENDMATLVTMADGTKSMITAANATDDAYVVVWLPISAMRLSMIRSILLPNLLFWTILILMTNFIQKVRKDNLENGDIGAEYIKIGKKHYIDRQMQSHIGASVLFGMILMILLVTYSQTLINYSNQNMEANSNLRNLEEVIVTNEANSRAIVEIFEYCNSLVTEAIATYYMEHPETLNDESLLRLVENMPNCRDITIYDKSGTSEYTTGAFKGYTLSHDESSEEYKCWELIDGTRNSLSYYENKDSFYVAGRRQDKDGIIRILVDATIYEIFNDLMSVDNTLMRADFKRANKIYTFIDDFSKLYVNEYGSDEIKVITNPISAEAMVDGYAGINRIEGIKYYINTREYNNYIFINAEKISNIRGMGVNYLIRTILVCFVLTYFLFVLTSLRTVSHMEDGRAVSRTSYELAHSIEEQMLDDRFKQMLKNVVVFSGIVLVTLLGIDAISANNSLLAYLFKSEWSHGINMFSVTMILIMTVGGIVFSIIMRTLILYVTTNMGPRGLTIGRMVSSLLKLAVLIFVIAKTLMYIGVNPATLLAGAGIAGAMISFCAQQTVNDLLSGFFIVFEGVFNIGDWIKVDEFRGQVVEIGVRTTKVAIGNNIQIINNSELKKITIMARNATGAICDVDIAYKEDASKVIKLINDNVNLYKNNIPEIAEGPYVDGVVELGASGVTIRIWALAAQGDVLKVERQMRRVTKQLFDDNNVEIPFTQITIHTDTE